MNGATAVARTLVASGVRVCFANPGTTELHLVATLDTVPELRGVLTLFEGVATGAADGYGRMAGTPAATLLHLGPGLANGLANLHNARRARTPVVNLVGDHATYHHRFDPPLESDVAALASTVSAWQRTTTRAADAAADAAEAVAAALAPPGGIATLVLPADVLWSTAGAAPAAPWPARPAPRTPADVVEACARSLRSPEPSALLLGGDALGEEGLRAAARVAAATGAEVLAETFPARVRRGAGLPAAERLPYLPELARHRLAGIRTLVLAGAPLPVSFFAYEGQPSELADPACAVHTLSGPGEDPVAALADLADALGAGQGAVPDVPVPARPALPSGPLSAETLAAAVGALLPPDAVVVDGSNTTGIWLPGSTAGAPPHDWLTLTGGAIGQCLPLATGAALATPDRRVVCLESDGSALYTIQALWTQAREGLDVTTVVLSNGAYAILELELGRVVGGSGPKASAMLELSPAVGFTGLATAMGVPATRAETADELVDQLARALSEPGPSLIEAVVPRTLS